MAKVESKPSRREFLCRTSGGLTSIGVLGLAPTVWAEKSSREEASPREKMVHRTLGRTGIEIPIVSMGVMNANNPELLGQSFDVGVRLFDTAVFYGEGKNEEMIGAAFEKLGIRDKVLIMTKAGFPGQRRWDQARRNLPEGRIKSEYLKDIEGSLKRLRTDYIDIVLHQGVASAEEVADEHIGEALTQLKEEGKAKYIGVSTHSGQAEVLNEVARMGFHDIALTGYNFTMAGDQDLARALENAAAKGVGIIAMKTQAGGRRRGDSGPINQTAALKWALRNDAVATAIPGYSNFDHLKENFAVAGNLELTPEEAEFLADQSVKAAMEFCQQCNGCVETCPRRVRIPELMRAHMYAAQYGNLVEARATLDAIPSAAGLEACTTCSSCNARCINTVNIARSIDELKLTYA